MLELDDERVRAEQICDRILTRAGKEAPVYRHFVAALRAAERARNEMIHAADDLESGAGDWDSAAGWDEIDAGCAGFSQERYAFLGAVEKLIATRRITRILSRHKASE